MLNVPEGDQVSYPQFSRSFVCGSGPPSDFLAKILSVNTPTSFAIQDTVLFNFHNCFIVSLVR